MSDEKDKEKKPDAAADEKKGAEGKDAKHEKTESASTASAKASPLASPWLPVLVVIILCPILTMVVSEMLILPRVKKTLHDIEAVQQANAQPAHGGATPIDDGHGKKEEKKKEKKAEKKGGHGEKKGGHGAKEGEGAEAHGKEVKFENVVANLLGSQKTRFVKVSFTVEGAEDDEEFSTVINENKTKLIDGALSILGALTVAELDEPGMKNIVRSDLVNNFNQILGKPIVAGLYFSEFVIQ